MIEYFASNLWQLWLLVALLCLILELTSGDLYVLCFSIGALVAMVSSLFAGVPFTAQVIVFAVASLLCLFFVRPSLVRLLHRGEDRPSNVDALIGREGRVTEVIVAGGYGRVAIDGDDWKAQSPVHSNIAVGTKVRVTARESVIIEVVPV